MLTVALDPLEHSPHLFRRCAIDSIRNQLGIAKDGVERRSQLMAHICEKLRLVLARFGKLAALILNLIEQPHVLDRDSGLVGKGHHQFNLPVGEWPHQVSCQSDNAYWRS